MKSIVNAYGRVILLLKIVISPYLSEKSSDFDEILYTAAYFELVERHVIENEKKLYWTDSEFVITSYLRSQLSTHMAESH